MRIIVSFDTEDFTDPATNDVLLELCRILREHDVRACFGTVGEKARFLRDSGRQDVIAAMAAHEIGYHSDNHFLFRDPAHPLGFASRIVEECDWDEAVRWLVATESRGLVDIETLFGRRPTMHQRTCGDSAAQLLAAYYQLGLTTYAYGLSIDERTRHIAWFANMLCISLPLIGEETVHAGDAPARLDELAAAGADLVNIRFHPCRFLCDEWWDGPHNYMGRDDPPARPPYAPTPHVPAAETTRRLDNFAATLAHARSRHGAGFTTYDELAGEVAPDPAVLPRAAVLRIARKLVEDRSARREGGCIVSPAEALAAIVWALLHPEAETVPFRHPFGPTALPPPVTATGGTEAATLLTACQAVEDALASKGRLPAAVPVGGGLVAPATFLRAAAALLTGDEAPVLRESGPYPVDVAAALRRWDEISHDLVAYFPQRGRPVPNTKQALKLQYWTYRPAELPIP